MQQIISNKIQGRPLRRDLVIINNQVDKILQSPVLKNSIKLNLENVPRSTSEQFATPLNNNKQQYKNGSNLSHFSKDGLSFGLTEREMNLCSNEILAMQSHRKNLLGAALSVRTSLQNQIQSPKLIELSNLEYESPKIRKDFKFKEKEYQTNQEIQQKVEEMKVNYIKSSVTLNQQLNDNTRLLQKIDELKKQQQNLSLNNQFLNKDQNKRQNKKVAMNMKINNNKQLIGLKQQALIDLIAKQQLIIQDLQKKLQYEKTEKQCLKLLCQSPKSELQQIDLNQIDIRKSQTNFDSYN
ncbi:unnamed protein product [Paramecium pentaurelia]|uniref:Uncharacterized protein n=1 Tax=Paramecium pentaurelia TaxID=43138 RepID=A0A8S1W6R7_9CILI|nr:unnamed protein product [Paramecium pentaurelia]